MIFLLFKGRLFGLDKCMHHLQAPQRWSQPNALKGMHLDKDWSDSAAWTSLTHGTQTTHSTQPRRPYLTPLVQQLSLKEKMRQTAPAKRRSRLLFLKRVKGFFKVNVRLQTAAVIVDLVKWVGLYLLVASAQTLDTDVRCSRNETTKSMMGHVLLMCLKVGLLLA